MNPISASLRRELGLGGAIMMGLGSIVGTGVFVSIGIGAGLAGPAVLLAIGLAGRWVMGTRNRRETPPAAKSDPAPGP